MNLKIKFKFLKKHIIVNFNMGVAQFLTNTFLFGSAIFGIALNRRNFLTVLMCIELILLSINLNFALFSSYLDDFYGQIFFLFILAVAAAESAIGLAVIIVYYKFKKSIAVHQKQILRF